MQDDFEKIDKHAEHWLRDNSYHLRGITLFIVFVCRICWTADTYKLEKFEVEWRWTTSGRGSSVQLTGSASEELGAGMAANRAMIVNASRPSPWCRLALGNWPLEVYMVLRCPKMS